MHTSNKRYTLFSTPSFSFGSPRLVFTELEISQDPPVDQLGFLRVQATARRSFLPSGNSIRSETEARFQNYTIREALPRYRESLNGVEGMLDFITADTPRK